MNKTEKLSIEINNLIDKTNDFDLLSKLKLLSEALNTRINMSKLYTNTLNSTLNKKNKQIKLDEIDSLYLKACLDQNNIINILKENHNINLTHTVR